MPKESYMDFLIDSIIGTRDYLKRMYKVKGLPPHVANDFEEKVEKIIEMSGKLGKLVQREHDLKELKELHLEIYRLKREGR